MKFKGTPGQWLSRPTEAKQDDGVTPLFYEIITTQSEGQSFISTHMNIEMGVTAYQEKANAQLISCAPEMLDALIDLKQTIEFLASKGYTNENSAAMQRAKDVIKRATTV